MARTHASLVPHDERDEVYVGDVPIALLMGYTRVQLIKEYGPTIFADLRITANLERGCWVIERSTGNEGHPWKEWATVPAQLDEDFEEEEDSRGGPESTEESK